MISAASLLVVLAVPAWAMAIQCVAFRVPSLAKRGSQAVTVASIAASVLGALALAPVLGPVAPLDWLFLAGLAVSFGHVYFHVFNMSETARRIRILVTIREGGSSVDADRDPREMLRIRLERLVALGTLARENGTLSLRPSLLAFVARLMAGYERLLFPDRR